MKNLFKNLMLVAVAAMAFTACSHDVNEVNVLEKKTTLEFVASFDGDTRSGFTGSSENENGKVVYHSEWFGGETVMLVAGDQVKTATVDAEGKFTATFDGEISQIDIYTPMESFYKPYMDYNFYQVNPEVLAEQTPLANSVDPKAHVAKGYAMVDGEGNQIIPVSLAHEVAYGKMTVKGVDFKINKVKLSFNGGTTYTINADNVENNTFWFATEPIDVAEFTVTAYDDKGNAVTKTVDVAAADKTLAFNYGRVSTFSVSGLEEPAVPVFTGATWENTSKPGDKFIQFYSSELGTLQLNFYKCNTDPWIDARTYGFAQTGDIYPGGEFSWYKPAGATEALYVTAGSVVVTVVDGQYHFEFIGLTDYSGSYSLTSSFTGEIAGLDIPDTRTPLATPTNVTATAEGKIITIKWDAVEGADEYYVFCYEGGLEAITTAETSVTIEAAYSTKYSFLIRALANESNPDYKTNENDEVYFNVTTGKDPNVWADVVANNIVWDSTNGAFKMTGEVVSGTVWGHSGDFIRLYINESDRPGNNSIKVGTYTGCGGKNPQAGQFGARFSLYWGTPTYESAFGSDSTVEVSYDETVGYTIVLTYNGTTYGYKGKPDGWVAPSEGGDQPEQPTPDQPDQPEPDVTDEDFTNWNYGAVIDQGSGIVELTDRSGTGRVVEFKLNQVAIAKFYGDTTKSSHFTDVKVDGVSATATAESWFQFGRSTQMFVEIDMTINGVRYTGKAASLSY